MEMIRSIPRPLVTEPQRSPAQELTAERLRELLHYEPETGIFTRKIGSANQVKAGDVAGSPNGDGYLLIRVQSRRYLAHRLAWLHYYGTWPTLLIDHINQVKSDNRIVNLREVTNSENLQNRGCVRGKSTPKGVSLNQQGSSLYAIAGLRIGSKRFAKAFKVVNGDVASAVGLAEQTYKMWQMEHHTHAPV